MGRANLEAGVPGVRKSLALNDIQLLPFVETVSRGETVFQTVRKVRALKHIVSIKGMTKRGDTLA